MPLDKTVVVTGSINQSDENDFEDSNTESDISPLPEFRENIHVDKNGIISEFDEDEEENGLDKQLKADIEYYTQAFPDMIAARSKPNLLRR